MAEQYQESTIDTRPKVSSIIINTSEEVKAKDPSQMTEEEKKARLDEIKR